jgi:prefoldin subunit 5
MIMKIGFHRKKEPDLQSIPAADSGTVPVDRVASLSSQGMSEPEIIRTLRSEGYSPMEVDSAMKEALRSAVKPSGPRMMPPAQQPRQLAGPPMDRSERRMIFSDDDSPPRQMARRPELPFASDEEMQSNELELPRLPGIGPQRRPAPPLPMEDSDIDELEPISPMKRHEPKEERMQNRREFEEIAEGVIEEKWDSFEKRMDDMGDRIKELTVRVNNLQQAMDRTQGERRGDMAEITEKIESYKQGMSEVSSRMEAMERTMKDSMTPMMQSLRSLSEAIKAFKETRR